MTYNGFYFRLFSGAMKRVLAEKYGPQYAKSGSRPKPCRR